MEVLQWEVPFVRLRLEAEHKVMIMLKKFIPYQGLECVVALQLARPQHEEVCGRQIVIVRGR